MANRHGDFIWYELLTSDADAAGDFYGKVIGWTSKGAGQPGVDYRFFFAGDGSNPEDGVGGYMTITPDMASGGARPVWLGYIAVDDIDASVASILASGGAVQMPAMDLPNVGRMAMVTDGQGIPFYVMKGASDQTSHSFEGAAPRIGHCGWNELVTSDQASAEAFYTTQFGWEKGDAMDMGPMGKYQFINHGGVLIGAVMTRPQDGPSPMWNYYFRVTDIDVAVAAVTAGGGQILTGPMEVPGEQWVIQGSDPQGAAFALVGARK
jgi:predicted enzyme related to lactoylglutathione lyase